MEVFDIKSDQYKNENKTVIKNMKIGDQFLSSEICKFQYFNLKVAIEGLYFQFLKRFLPATNEYENLSMRTTRSFRDWVAYIPLVGDIVNHNDALSQREILKNMIESTKTNFQQVDSEIHAQEHDLKQMSKIFCILSYKIFLYFSGY